MVKHFEMAASRKCTVSDTESGKLKVGVLNIPKVKSNPRVKSKLTEIILLHKYFPEDFPNNFRTRFQ